MQCKQLFTKKLKLLLDFQSSDAMKLFTILLVLSILSTSTALFEIVHDVLDLAYQIFKGIFASSPSLHYVFESIRNLVAGLPLEIAANVANSICEYHK